MQSGGYQERTLVGPRPRWCRASQVTCASQPAPKRARRVALDGQGGQRREAEQLAGLREQSGPAAVGHRESEAYPAGGG